jgi:hypothetical protein
MTSAAEICVRLFKSVGMPLGPGLTAEQLDQVEADFAFTFDVDHREMLGLVTPLGDGWVDWRSTPPAQIRAMLAWPTEGVIWDARNNGFWPRAWGRKPKRSDDLDSAVLDHLSRVPRLIPLFGHRFMAAGPSQGSAPVFSVYQTDVIYYGENLPDYVAHELEISKRFTTGVHRAIPFWSALAENDRRYVGRREKVAQAFWNRSIVGGAALPTESQGEPTSYTSTKSDGTDRVEKS